MLSLLYLGVKARQYFVRSSCLFLGKKTLLKIWFNSGLNVTNFRGTRSHFPPIWPQMRTRKGSVALALSKANFVSRSIGLKQINPLPYCQCCIQYKDKKEPFGSLYTLSGHLHSKDFTEVDWVQLVYVVYIIPFYEVF